LQNNPDAEADVQPEPSTVEFAERESQRIAESKAYREPVHLPKAITDSFAYHNAYQVADTEAERYAIQRAISDAYQHGLRYATTKRNAETLSYGDGLSDAKTQRLAVSERFSKYDADRDSLAASVSDFNFKLSAIAERVSHIETVIDAEFNSLCDTVAHEVSKRVAKSGSVSNAVRDAIVEAVTVSECHARADILAVSERLAKLEAQFNAEPVAERDAQPDPVAVNERLANFDANFDAYRGSDPIPKPSRPNTVSASERGAFAYAISNRIRAAGADLVAVRDAIRYALDDSRFPDTEARILGIADAIVRVRRGLG
jgi:hypothetical protein